MNKPTITDIKILCYIILNKCPEMADWLSTHYGEYLEKKDDSTNSR